MKTTIFLMLALVVAVLITVPVGAKISATCLSFAAGDSGIAGCDIAVMEDDGGGDGGEGGEGGGADPNDIAE